MKHFEAPILDWNYATQQDWCCEHSLSQSPIDIETATLEPMMDTGKIQLTYSRTVDTVFDTGSAIQGIATGTANINNRFFNLQQFHFHTHSEHKVDGKTCDAELHFVHEAQNGRLAVLGVFLVEGRHNETLQTLLDAINTNQSIHNVYLYDLLPTISDYYHYLGSLTTPPLTENVEWYLFKETVEISHKQLQILKNYHANNCRHTQPLNGRKVLFKSFNKKS